MEKVNERKTIENQWQLQTYTIIKNKLIPTTTTCTIVQPFNPVTISSAVFSSASQTRNKELLVLKGIKLHAFSWLFVSASHFYLKAVLHQWYESTYKMCVCSFALVTSCSAFIALGQYNSKLYKHTEQEFLIQIKTLENDEYSKKCTSSRKLKGSKC